VLHIHACHLTSRPPAFTCLSCLSPTHACKGLTLRQEQHACKGLTLWQEQHARKGLALSQVLQGTHAQARAARLQGTRTQASAALCRTALCCKGLALRQVLHFAVQPSAASDTHTAKSSTPARDSHSGKSRLQVHPKLSKQDTHSLPCATRAHTLCCTTLQEYEYMHPDANTPGAAGVCGVGSVAHLAELQPKQRCASACTSSHTHTGGMSALNVQCTKMGVLSAARPLGCLSRGITGEPGVQLPTATLTAGGQQVHGTRSTYQ